MCPARWKITSYLQTRAGNKACEMADFLDPNAPTLPRILQSAGYATAHIGKWHLGGGRDVIDPPKFSAYGYKLGLGTYESPEPAAALGLKTVPWGKQDQLEKQQVPRHQRTAWMIDQTIKFMHDHKSQPCFINLWLDDTHTPFNPSDEQMERVKTPGEGEQKTKYKAVLSAMDQQIGRLLDKLAGTNTLVLLIGDNGASPPFERERVKPLRGQKLSLYEGGVRVPFLVWRANSPRTQGDINQKTVISTLDLLPTLAKFCQVDLPTNYVGDGEVMESALAGEMPTRKGKLYWEYGRNNTSFDYPRAKKKKEDRSIHRSPNLALRDGQWKLLLQADGSQVELYDLSRDFKEEDNVANAHPEIVERMRTDLLRWRRSMP